MKLNDPRFTLIAGLALALGMEASASLRAAEKASTGTLRFVKAQMNGVPTPMLGAPGPGLPSLSPTPYSSLPSPPSDHVAPDPVHNMSPGMISPIPLGSQPNLAPANRPPLGMFYGEQDKLDAMTNPGPRPLPTVPYPGSSIPQPSPSGIVEGGPFYGSSSDVLSHSQAIDRFGFAPPPGTLGQTYKRRTRLVDDKKHPRVGIVEVNLPEGVEVSAIGLKSKWTGKLWQLESDPLLPGVPHIYEIKASWGEGTAPQYRTIRLIMGRVVDLDF